MKLGSWSLTGSLRAIEIFADSSLDYVVLDFEHGQNRIDQLSTATSLLRKSGKIVVARFVSPGLREMQASFDSCVDYVQVAGVRKLSDCSFHLELQSEVGWSPWVQRASGNHPPGTKLIFQIEFKDAFNEFMATKTALPEGGYFLGRYDLARSMGYELGGRQDAENVQAFYSRCVDLGVTPWIVSTGESDLEALIRLGYEHISLGSDSNMLTQGIRSMVKELDRIMGGDDGSRH